MSRFDPTRFPVLMGAANEPETLRTTLFELSRHPNDQRLSLRELHRAGEVIVAAGLRAFDLNVRPRLPEGEMVAPNEKRGIGGLVLKRLSDAGPVQIKLRRVSRSGPATLEARKIVDEMVILQALVEPMVKHVMEVDEKLTMELGVPLEGQPSGTCTHCFRTIIIERGRIARHAFELSGCGIQDTPCAGSRYEPMERGDEGYVAAGAMLAKRLAYLQTQFQRVGQRDVFPYLDDAGVKLWADCRHPRFDELRVQMIESIERDIKAVIRDQQDHQIGLMKYKSRRAERT